MTIEELRVLITAKTEGLREGINKATSRLKGFKKSSDDASSAVNKNVQNMKNQYDQLIKKLDNVNAQAELQQRKLAELREKYSRFSVLGKDSPKATKLQEQILRTESRLYNLISTSDKTASKISDLEEKMNSAGVSTEKTSDKFKSLKDKLEQIRGKFQQTGRSAEKSTGKIAGFSNMLNRSFMRILKRIFIYNLIYKMIRGLINYMNGALKTNNQFANSLNAIRTNLRVAFQPIYDFILPAINALMRGLATLTTYIANFTSALFGKTYKQSYDAAKGIETAKKAMDGYGSSAKKTKGQLASFDEINVLNTDKEESGGGSKDFEMSMPEMEKFEFGWVDKLKEKLEPTIEAFQRLIRSLEPLKAFVAQGAIDFYNKFLVPVGNWTFGEGLPRFIDAITNGLGKIDWSRINDSLNRLWEALTPFTINVGEGLLWLWENVLVPFGTWIGNEIVPRFLELLANVLNILNITIEAFKPFGQWLWKEFLKPIAEWTGGKILEILDWLNEKLKNIGNWMKEHMPLMETIASVLGIIAVSIGIVKGAIIAKTTAINLAKGAWVLFKGALAALTGPIGVTVLAISGIVAILIGLWKTNEEFRENVKKIWEQIKEIYKIATEFIKNKIIEEFNKIKEFWEKHGEKIKSITKIVWDGIGNFINSALKIIQGLLDIFIGVFTGDWDRMSEGLKKIWSGMWNAIENIVKTAWGVLSTAFGDLYKNISSWFTGLAKDALGWGKNVISGFADGIRSMVGKVGDAAKSVAGKVSDLIGFHSPTKEGPGRDADRWMPNLMNMLAEGIEDNVYKVSAAVDITANTLSGVQKADNTSSIINAISGALGNSNSSGDTTIIVKIGEETLTEKVISNINRQNRISGKTVITV